MSGLDDMIAALKRLDGDGLEARVATRASPLLEEALRASADAGQTPDGKPWKARKEGGQAYAGASSKISVKSYGAVVRATLTGPEVYGNFGTEKLPKRQMLPDAGAAIPPLVTDVLEQAAADEFDAVMGGA
jgi:hypothetical protein